MEMSAHSLAQAKESQQEHTTFSEQFTKEGYGGSADAKHLKAPRNVYASSLQDKNGGLVESFIKQGGSLPRTKFDSEEANLSVEPHIVEKQTMEPITASIQIPIRNIGIEKGAQITCSSPSDFDVASSSLVLSKEDVIKQELGSHPIDLVSAESNGLDSSPQQKNFGFDDGFDARTDGTLSPTTTRH